VVLHELLTGKNEFAGQTQAETLQRVMQHTPQSVHGVRDDAPDDIDTVLARAMSKTPAERYGSAAEFAQALRRMQRTPEPELRARLAAFLRKDFDELADVLGIESLASRDRAWRRFSVAPPPPAGATDSEAIHDQPTRVLDEITVERQREASEEALIAKTAAVDEPLISSAVSPRSPARDHAPAPAHAPARRTSVTTWLALAIALSAAAGVAVLALRENNPQRVVVLQPEHHSPAPFPRPAQPAGTAVAVSPPSAPDPSPTAEPSQPAPAETSPAVPAAATEAAPAARPRAAHLAAAPDPAALTRAFRRKQAQIEACFSASGAGAPSPAIEIHFEVDPSGRTLRADVVPASIAATPLGGCLTRAALATRFPPQAGPVAFRIPVTAKQIAVQ
jgi:hypothetical protein